jgi:hypothetical protein
MGSARLRFLTLCGGEETMKKEKGKLVITLGWT